VAPRDVALVKIGLIVVAVGLLVFLTVTIFPGLAPPVASGIRRLLGVVIPSR
jgi:hypothetical protein